MLFQIAAISHVVCDHSHFQINAEFKWITTMPLQYRFLSQLDVHSEKLIRLFKNRGQIGRRLGSIIAPMDEVSTYILWGGGVTIDCLQDKNAFYLDK